ncbi:MAG: cyclase [Candidatus Azotimanducaceae bacterium]|jgi:cyclase
MKKSLFTLIAFASLYATAADDRWAKVEIKVIPVTDGIYMLTGAGGNIGVSYGSDGMLLIDDQFEPLAPKIKAALKTIGDETPTFLLNTHYHGDHTGGNVQFGEDSIIMSHHNVRIRLLNDTEGNFPKQALPVITYENNVSIHFNDEKVDLIHAPSGHTDGDTMVHFNTSNVLHMGDNFFNHRFPYVDIDAGGSVDGLITAIDHMLSIMNNETKVIAGHGELGNKTDLALYLVMLKETSTTVKQSIADGKTESDILSTGLDQKWDSWGDHFISTEMWLKTLHASYK